jgi:hypothetical protein
MNLDELRSALREPAPVPLSVSLDRVVARGRRRRAVRRAAVPMAVVATAAAVAVPATVLGGTADAPVAAPTAPTATPTPGTPPSTAPGRGIPGAAWDDLIRTGERVAGRERVFWFHPVRDAQMPGIRFLVAFGYRDPGGSRRVVTGVNEVTAPDDSPGFHAAWFSDRGPVMPAGDWVVYGYYAGPVERITAMIGGRTVTARLARWAGNPRITVFWLSPATGSPRPASNTAITRLRAYDAAGKPLPAGNPEVGIG